MRSRTARLGRALGALAVVAGLAACDPPPPPVVLTVDSTGVGADADPGDGLCATSGGECTLQAAVDEAGATAIDRIDVPAGWEIPAPSVYVVDPVTSPLTIASTVPNDPATILGGFDLTSGSLVVNDLVLGAGATSAATVGPASTLVLNRTTIRDRGAAGIQLDTGDEPTAVVLVDSTIEGGAADAVAVAGWSASVTLLRSTISDNAGAAVDLGEYSSATVLESEIRGNAHGVIGSDSPITVRRSILADNTGTAVGTDFDPIVIEDSTITGATSGVTGGDNDVAVRRSTIVGNDTGIRADWSTSVDLVATTLANDVDLAATGDAAFTVAGNIVGGTVGCDDIDGFASFVSGGHNVVADTSCGFAGSGDQEGVDPLLGALSDDGGPTPTVVPAPGSPAIDLIPAGTPDLCVGGVVDQRGTARPVGPACDAGAVEAPLPVPGGAIVVDSAADAPDTDPWDDVCQTAAGECTLRAAFQQASKAYDTDLDPSTSAAIAITPGIDPVLDPALGRVRTHGNVTVHGGGAVVDGAGAAGVLRGCYGTFTLLDLTVTGGGAGRAAVGNDGCSASLVLDGVTVEGNAGNGVGTDGTLSSLTLSGSTVVGNAGVGVVGEVTDLVVDGSTVSGNLFGISIDPVSSGTGSVTVVDSTVDDNTWSGITVQEHELAVEDSTISGNGASGMELDSLLGAPAVRRSTLVGNGTGISLGGDGGAVLAVEDSTVTGSTDAGIDAVDNDVVVRRSTIADNGAAELTGSPYASVSLSGSIVAGPGVACGELPDFPGSPVPVTSGGGNVVSDTSCALAGPGDVEGVDPLLGALGDNGGATATRLPGAGSPAIDAIAPGTPGLCTAGLTDQRGVTRPQGAGCDVGAVEQ